MPARAAVAVEPGAALPGAPVGCYLRRAGTLRRAGFTLSDCRCALLSPVVALLRLAVATVTCPSDRRIDRAPAQNGARSLCGPIRALSANRDSTFYVCSDSGRSCIKIPCAGREADPIVCARTGTRPALPQGSDHARHETPLEG